MKERGTERTNLKQSKVLVNIETSHVAWEKLELRDRGTERVIGSRKGGLKG